MQTQLGNAQIQPKPGQKQLEGTFNAFGTNWSSQEHKGYRGKDKKRKAKY